MTPRGRTNPSRRRGDADGVTPHRGAIAADAHAVLLGLQRAAGNVAARGILGRSPLARWDDPTAVTGEGNAEVVRLEGEISSLAKRNAWTGVLRAYASIEELGAGLAKRSTHLSAAMGEANVNGVTPRHVTLLDRVIAGPAADDDPVAVEEARRQREAVDAAYRRVFIRRGAGGAPVGDDGGGGFLGGLFGGGKEAPAPQPGAPALEPAAMPFGTVERTTVLKAAEKLAQSGGFRGYLPLGDYRLGERSFTVDAGAGELDITY